MVVFKNKYVTIENDAINKISIATWTDETENAKDEDFKKWNIELLHAVEQNKSIGIVSNTLKYQFVVNLKLQDWSGENLFAPLAKAGLKITAMILPDGMFQQVSIEQLMDESEDGGLKIKYFTDLEKGEKWLLEKVKDLI